MANDEEFGDIQMTWNMNKSKLEDCLWLNANVRAVTVFCSPMERCPSIDFRNIDVGVVFNQEFRDIQMPWNVNELKLKQPPVWLQSNCTVAL